MKINGIDELLPAPALSCLEATCSILTHFVWAVTLRSSSLSFTSKYISRMSAIITKWCSLKRSRTLTSSGSNAGHVSKQLFSETPFSVFADPIVGCFLFLSDHDMMRHIIKRTTVLWGNFFAWTFFRSTYCFVLLYCFLLFPFVMQDLVSIFFRFALISLWLEHNCS